MLNLMVAIQKVNVPFVAHEFSSHVKPNGSDTHFLHFTLNLLFSSHVKPNGSDTGDVEKLKERTFSSHVKPNGSDTCRVVKD